MSVMEAIDWNEQIKRVLKSELVKRGVSHEVLAKRLNSIGINETKSSVDSKISRGTFSAVFFMQCLHVLESRFIITSNPPMIAAEPYVEYNAK